MSLKICLYSRVWGSGSGGMKSTRELVNGLRNLGHEVVVSKDLVNFLKTIGDSKPDIVIHQNVKDLPIVVKICKRMKIPVFVTVNSYITCATSMHITMEGFFGKDCLYCSLPKVVKCLYSGIKYGNPSLPLKLRDSSIALGHYLNVKLRIKALNEVDKVIVLSPTMKKIFSISGVDEEKMYVIPQPIGEEYFRVNGKVDNDEDPYLLLLTTHWHKGAHVAAEAFKIVKETVEDARLVVAGGETKCLRHMRSILKDDFEYVGWVTGENLLRLYSNSYAVLFPSLWYEAFGRVWAEACAMGKPVIAFKGRGGASDYLEHEKTGLLSEYSVKSYATEIIKLYENKKLCRRISKNAKRFARKELHTSVVIRRYLGLLDEI